MNKRTELCEKIRSIYPEIGECGAEVFVDYDDIKKAWTVDLKKGIHSMKTYLAPEDTDACMNGERCVNIGVQIAQLLTNIDRTD
jgi:hypothetical protein